LQLSNSDICDKVNKQAKGKSIGLTVPDMSIYILTASAVR